MLESAPIIDEDKNSFEKKIEELESENENIIKELDDLKDKHIQLQAEFENFRKRKAKEADEIRDYASSRIICEVLTVLDHFDIALDSSHDRSDPNWSKGIDIIAKQLSEILKLNGLSEITPNAGEKFDHNEHEALAKEPSNEFKSDTIIRSVRKGYKLKGRLLRPAQVIIASAPANNESAPIQERK